MYKDGHFIYKTDYFEKKFSMSIFIFHNDFRFMKTSLDQLKSDLLKELETGILPFWMSRMTDPEGGFYGRMDGSGVLHREAERGAVLNARILWTFASAYRILGRKEYLDTAQRAFKYIGEHFIDKEYGGVYWSLKSDGSPLDTKKQFYAIAFTIYGLAEYHLATGDRQAVDLASALFRSVEAHSRDRDGGGYIEACTREWGTIEDMRLSDRDRNDVKTMNTHLHILEAYSALYRVWKDDSLALALNDLICIFLDRIIRKDGHLGLFFGEDWTLHSTMVSYGHDIEASWLLCEAAETLGDGALLERVREASAGIATASLEGFTPGGGMEYERDPEAEYRNTSRDWWVQAETVVGCAKMYRLTGDGAWLERASSEWDFIRRNIICPDGEWYWSALPDDRGGFVPNTSDDRAGFWKCPYHNSRMCMEIAGM